MNDDRTPDDQRSLAVGLFDRTWELLEQADRGAPGDRDLLASALASRLHWEGLAGAHAVAGQDEERDRWAGGRRTLESVDDDEDRELIESQLATVPALSAGLTGVRRLP